MLGGCAQQHAAARTRATSFLAGFVDSEILGRSSSKGTIRGGVVEVRLGRHPATSGRQLRPGTGSTTRSGACRWCRRRRLQELQGDLNCRLRDQQPAAQPAAQASSSSQAAQQHSKQALQPAPPTASDSVDAGGARAAAAAAAALAVLGNGGQSGGLGRRRGGGGLRRWCGM